MTHVPIGSATDRQREGASRKPVWMRLIFLLPIVTFMGLAMAFLVGLGRDASEIPSALIGKGVPLFDLPPVQGRKLGLSSKNLSGDVSLMNVFASWCVACKAEHPVLMRLAAGRVVPVHGIDYKDAPADAAGWLDANGDPYTRTGADRDGRVAIDWGIYGVPETFVIGADGRIVLRHVGPLTEDDLRLEILPLVAKLRHAGAGGSP
jgi:cytochrome c biogenesis protein CcmG/thiol:disulfide interchange protein DsbE